MYDTSQVFILNGNVVTARIPYVINEERVKKKTVGAVSVVAAA